MLLVLGACAAGAPSGPAGAGVPEAVARRAAAGDRLFPPAVEDSILAAEQGLTPAARVAAWALRFAAADSVRYLFGPAPGGYVDQGALVADHVQDCVSLLYRTTELARARDGRDAVARALATRFAGAAPAAVADSAGRVDYDHPAHLDYSLDMIRSGLWGDDVTAAFAGTVVDTAGSARYEPGAFRYLPRGAPALRDLAAGDIVWFVLDPAREAGARLRREYGLVIGHVGLVGRGDGAPLLVHAASGDLPGRYAGGTVVTVPLDEYLARVEKFCGVVITRLPAE